MPDKIVCPVCHGTKLAYDNRNREYFKDSPCKSCEGTGLAPWCEAFKARIASGLIKVPQRKKKSSLKGTPRHIILSQHTDSYEAYVTKSRGVGIDPKPRAEMFRTRQYYREERGLDGLSWLEKWSEAEQKIALESQSYAHYRMCIELHNREHATNLPVRKPATVSGFRRRRPKSVKTVWSKNGAYWVEKLDEATSLPTGTTKSFASFNLLRDSVRTRSNIFISARGWSIVDIKQGVSMGTTLDLKEFVRKCSKQAKRPTKGEYFAWLKEKT